MMIQRIVHPAGNLFAAVIFVLLGATGTASAQQSARDYFDPIVSHHQFTVFIRNFDIARDQRRIVEMVFLDYVDAIDALVAQADAQADQVGRKTVNDALAGRVIIDPAELRRLRLAVLGVYETHFEHVDREFDKLTLGVRSVLNEPQRPTFDADVRRLRRVAALHPRHADRNSNEYAGEGVDVLVLAEDAAGQGGELHGLYDPSSPSGNASLAPILQRYEHDLDRYLIDTASAYRIARMQLRKARISRDPDDIRAAEAAAIDQWNRLYSLNLQAVKQIGEVIAASVGASAQDRWLQRFDEACFAWLFAQSTPDRQHDWLMRQNLSQQQQASVQEIYEAYLDRRYALSHRAIELMIQGRTEHVSIVHSMMNPNELHGGARRVFDDLLRNSGEMATLDAYTATEFEKVLNEHQLRTFRNAFRRR